MRESRPKTKTDSQTHETYTPTLGEMVSDTLTSRGVTKYSPMHNLFLWVAKEVHVSNLHNSHAAYYPLPVLRTG